MVKREERVARPWNKPRGYTEGAGFVVVVVVGRPRVRRGLFRGMLESYLRFGRPMAMEWDAWSLVMRFVVGCECHPLK